MRRIKIISLACAFFLTAISQSANRDYTFAWDYEGPSPDHFVLLYTVALTQTPPLQTTNWTSSLIPGTARVWRIRLPSTSSYYGKIVAVSSNQVSEASNVVTIFGPPTALRVQ